MKSDNNQSKKRLSRQMLKKDKLIGLNSLFIWQMNTKYQLKDRHNWKFKSKHKRILLKMLFHD